MEERTFGMCLCTCFCVCVCTCAWVCVCAQVSVRGLRHTERDCMVEIDGKRQSERVKEIKGWRKEETESPLVCSALATSSCHTHTHTHTHTRTIHCQTHY